MHTIRISDITLRQNCADILSFREKIELVKLLDRLEVDVIELDQIKKEKADSLFIKTVASTATTSCISVRTAPDQDSIDTAWEALKGAVKPRIQIAAPISLVQMEYINHMSTDELRGMISEAVKYARTLTDDVEFCAEDATRAEKDFLYDIIETAAAAGATAITLCDSAGTMLPDEFSAFTKDVLENANTPGANGVILGISACNELAMADACSIAALRAGAAEIKASIFPDGSASVENLAKILKQRGDEFEISSSIRTVEIERIALQVANMFTQIRSKTSPFENGVQDGDERFFSAADDISAIIKETKALGYELSDEDKINVYERFKNIAAKKDRVSAKEIDAIIASSAMQVPSTYKIEDYIINSGNVISATAHVRLKKNGEIKESVAIGDGPVDAAFLAIEQIAGRHFELDDFQIRSVTEGREAMGETIVKLRSNGKLYSGRGISTDIIGSSIRAYISALNKIVYEEED